VLALASVFTLAAAAIWHSAGGWHSSAFRSQDPSGALNRASGTQQRRIALLHKVHGSSLTLRGLHAALLAKQQVEAAGGWYGVLYSTHPDLLQRPAAAGTPERISLDLLRHVVGGGGSGGSSNASVMPVGRGEVAAALGEGLLAEQRRVVGQAEWAWVTNDAVDVAWWAALLCTHEGLYCAADATGPPGGMLVGWDLGARGDGRRSIISLLVCVRYRSKCGTLSEATAQAFLLTAWLKPSQPGARRAGFCCTVGPSCQRGRTTSGWWSWMWRGRVTWWGH